MAVYAWEDGQLVEKQPVEVLSIDECLARCGTLDRPVLLLGDAAVKKVAGRKELPRGVQIALPHIVMPRAAGTALLGLRRLAAGQVGSVMATAFVVSIASIKFLLRYIKNNDFKAFGWYRIVLGIIVIAYLLLVGDPTQS